MDKINGISIKMDKINGICITGDAITETPTTTILITCQIVDFAVPADHRVKFKESEKKDKYFDLAWELKKTVEHESDDYTNYNWCSWYSHQRTDKGTVGLEMGGRVVTIQTSTLL